MSPPVAKIFSDEFPSEDRMKTLLFPLVILSRFGMLSIFHVCVFVAGSSQTTAD